jgi:hypothetical protein
LVPSLPTFDRLRIKSETGTRPVAVPERSEFVGVRVDPLTITPEQLGDSRCIQHARRGDRLHRYEPSFL